MSDTIRILFISDIVGSPGVQILQTLLPGLKQKIKPDFIIANGENAHQGRGINDQIVKTLFDLEVDVITGGNHSFDKHLVFPLMKKEPRLLRPFNYPRENPGFGYGIYPVRNRSIKIGVINLIGRTFLSPVNDPFDSADYLVDKIKEETPLIFVDMHAEATAEKMAMGWYMDGQVSAVVGTHTHIPTNDARILPGGTGYLTDAGMTGSFDSVLGLEKETAIRRFKLGTPQRYQEATGDPRICYVLLDIDTDSGKCRSIQSHVLPEFELGRNG